MPAGMQSSLQGQLPSPQNSKATLDRHCIPPSFREGLSGHMLLPVSQIETVHCPVDNKHIRAECLLSLSPAQSPLMTHQVVARIEGASTDLLTIVQLFTVLHQVCILQLAVSLVAAPSPCPHS